MNLYAESSAVLAWISAEPAGRTVLEILDSADMVLTSNLTLVECERVLVRSVAAGDLAEEDFVRRRLLLESASGLWSMVDLERGILARACRRFPREPLRTLDALHLASAITARQSVPDLALLSLDGRVRQNGAALGFDVLPA